MIKIEKQKVQWTKFIKGLIKDFYSSFFLRKAFFLSYPVQTLFRTAFLELGPLDWESLTDLKIW